MKINQGLKLKNQLVGTIAKFKARVLQNNRWVSTNKPAYNAKNELLAYQESVQELIKLKVGLSIASQPILKSILSIAEVKSQIEFLKNLNTKEGIESDRYGSNIETKYEVNITEVQKDTLIEELEKLLINLQDEIDQFNATTDI